MNKDYVLYLCAVVLSMKRKVRMTVSRQEEVRRTVSWQE